jgi:hypothetical protein
LFFTEQFESINVSSYLFKNIRLFSSIYLMLKNKPQQFLLLIFFIYNILIQLFIHINIERFQCNISRLSKFLSFIPKIIFSLTLFINIISQIFLSFDNILSSRFIRKRCIKISMHFCKSTFKKTVFFISHLLFQTFIQCFSFN